MNSRNTEMNYSQQYVDVLEDEIEKMILLINSYAKRVEELESK
jgi:hypothetical protein